MIFTMLGDAATTEIARTKDDDRASTQRSRLRTRVVAESHGQLEPSPGAKLVRSRPEAKPKPSWGRWSSPMADKKNEEAPGREARSTPSSHKRQARQHPDRGAARLRRDRRGARRRRCSIRATRRSTRSSSGRARTSRTATDLDVPVVPIYIQEKIHPQALIEDLRATRERGEARAAARPVRRLQRPRRLRAEGRVLPARPALVEPDDPRRLAAGDDQPRREGGARGKVQMIYFDPPYGIKFGSQLAGVHPQARREGRQGRGR